MPECYRRGTSSCQPSSSRDPVKSLVAGAPSIVIFRLVLVSPANLLVPPESVPLPWNPAISGKSPGSSRCPGHLDPPVLLGPDPTFDPLVSRTPVATIARLALSPHCFLPGRPSVHQV
ncbi:uncharacterized protein V3H82_004233 [Fundulus diaphanus]